MVVKLLRLIYENEPNLIFWEKSKTLVLSVKPFSRICMSNVKDDSFMCLTSTSIYIDYWKSFMKFEIKRSCGMKTYNLAWIALFSEQEHVMSTNLCIHAQTTLMEF
jgi:hypothetical protein